MTESELSTITELIGYRFKDADLLEKALTHSSSKMQDGRSNERLEFLGDAILGMVISDYLFESFLDYQEGELTRIKSVVVSRPILAEALQTLRIRPHIRIGRGLGQRKLPVSVLANVFEAVVAAIYKDSGLPPARSFILHNLREYILTVIDNKHERNHKSLLQQHAQKVMSATPSYRVMTQKGPDHAKEFEVVAVINGKEYIPGCGQSKKEAEQRSAEKTLKHLLEKNGSDPAPVAEDS